MEFNSVLPGVEITSCASVCRINDPFHRGASWQVNQMEFALQVPGVGSFYARNGKMVAYCAEPDADPDWVKLHLNGQMLVALLHQRKIINFHASSFIHDRKGIMVLGEYRSRKVITYGFICFKGAGFPYRRSDPRDL